MLMSASPLFRSQCRPYEQNVFQYDAGFDSVLSEEFPEVCSCRNRDQVFPEVMEFSSCVGIYFD